MNLNAKSMVFFLCPVCGESVKKAKVATHRCNCSEWSCMDCGKIFKGNDYNKHTSCISEAEKYQGHLYQGSKNSKETVAQIWLRSCAEAAERAATDGSLSPELQRLLPVICSLENIPRKKKKFDNFMKNQGDRLSQQSSEGAWNYISAIFVANKEAVEKASAASNSKAAAKKKTTQAAKKVSFSTCNR